MIFLVFLVQSLFIFFGGAMSQQEELCEVETGADGQSLIRFDSAPKNNVIQVTECSARESYLDGQRLLSFLKESAALTKELEERRIALNWY